MALQESDGPATESTTAFVIGGPLTGAEVAGLCRRLRVCFEESCADVVVCEVGALDRADAAALEALARLQLTALRLGRRIRLRGASPELQELLAFAGLSEVLPAGAAGLLGPSREAEEREQRVRVEECVEPDDPAV